MGGKGWAIVVVATAVVVGFFTWEWFVSPEARVKRTLEGAAEAAEAADVQGFLSFLAEDYADFRHRGKAELETALEAAFDRVDRLNVTLKEIRVEVLSPSEAQAGFGLVVVAFSGNERAVVIGTPFEPERMTVRLERGDGGWKIARLSRASTPSAVR